MVVGAGVVGVEDAVVVVVDVSAIRRTTATTVHPS